MLTEADMLEQVQVDKYVVPQEPIRTEFRPYLRLRLDRDRLYIHTKDET